MFFPFALAAVITGNCFCAAGTKDMPIYAYADETVSGSALDIGETLPNGVYSVPVKMVRTNDPDIMSMGNGALDGNAAVTVKNGKTEIDLNFKAVKYTGLYGHLLKLWSYPEAEEMNYDWWNTDAETPAEVIRTFSDYGMEYTMGNETQSEFIKTFRIERDNVGEKYFFVRVSVDAMAGFDQPARLDLDWDNAILLQKTDEPSESTTVTESSTETTTATTKSSSGGGGGSSVKKTSETLADGKYWLPFHLWHASLDQASMGDAAFENNRQALVTVSNGGKHVKIEIAANPVSVSGYTSALQDIASDDVNINIVKKENFTTNTRYDGKEHTFQRVSLFSFELDNTAAEYISVKISTPYTPMDNISENDGGFITARLKLDWSGASKTDDSTKISSNSSVASGSSSSGSGGSVNETDKETNIQIKADEYVFPNSTTFKTEQIASGAEFNAAKTLIGADEFRLFEIKAETGDKEVSPDGVADVYFPVLDTDKNVKIYRINKETKTQEASAAELEYKLSSDKKYYVITVKGFGLFAIAKTDEEMNVEVEYSDSDLLDDIAYNAAAAGTSFSDISEHRAKDHILKAVEKGLFNGVSENEFAPDTNTTRAMFVTVLGRLEGVEKETNKSSRFSDVKTDDYFYPYVVWASENGIISGVSDTVFAPYKPVTREQMCTMLYNYARYKGISPTHIYKMSFTDAADISAYAKEAVSELADAGIISGRPNGVFDPKGKATRAEIATMLVNFAEEYMKDISKEEISEDTETET